jgi:hypothetical protein
VTHSDWLTVAGIVAAPILALVGWLIAVGNRLTKLETQVGIFWKGVSFDAARILHSPDPKHRRMDELIELYLDGTATEPDIAELMTKLRDKLNDTNGERGERMTASTMLRALEGRKQLSR